MYSAWPPCIAPPVPTCCSQNIGLPRLHHSQRPQVVWTHGTPTRSPTLRVVTPRPIATISPAGSCPKIRGNVPDRKSTRLNSSHGYISYAVFCLKKKKNDIKKYTSSLNPRRLHQTT